MRISLAFICLFLAGLPACSDYQSFTEAPEAAGVFQHQRWQVVLPYDSGKQLSIARFSDSTLLVAEPKDGYQLVSIPLDPEGQPGSLQHQRLAHGKEFELLEDGQLLVTEEDDEEDYVTILDAGTLNQLFSETFSHAHSEETSTRKVIRTDGHEQVDHYLFFYHNEIVIDRHAWSDFRYQYSLPYVASSTHDLHVVDLRLMRHRRTLHLRSESLDGLKERLELGREILIAQGLMSASKGTFGKDKEDEEEGISFDQLMFFVDQLFVMDDGRTLVFSLATVRENRIYYSWDLEKSNAQPVHAEAEVLVQRYPDQLTLTEKDPEKEAEKKKSREITLSGKTYLPDQFKFFPLGIVMIGQKKTDRTDVSTGEAIFDPHQSIVGLLTFDLATLEISPWEHRLNWEGEIGSLISDSERGTLFYPDQIEKGYRVFGLSVGNGTALPGFPANILRQWNANKSSSILRIVGTAVDFEHKTLWIHDAEQNRIVCSELFSE